MRQNEVPQVPFDRADVSGRVPRLVLRNDQLRSGARETGRINRNAGPLELGDPLDRSPRSLLSTSSTNALADSPASVDGHLELEPSVPTINEREPPPRRRRKPMPLLSSPPPRHTASTSAREYHRVPPGLDRPATHTIRRTDRSEIASSLATCTAVIGRSRSYRSNASRSSRSAATAPVLPGSRDTRCLHFHVLNCTLKKGQIPGELALFEFYVQERQ